MVICENPDVLRVIFFGKEIINIVKIVIPIALIIFGMIGFTKAVISSDEKVNKKNISLFFKRILNAILVFTVPWIVELFIVTIGDIVGEVNYTDCLQNVTADKIAEFDAITLEQENVNNGNDISEDSYIYSNDTSNNYTILVGDSRVVGMCMYTDINDNTDCSIAEVGKGSYWFKNNAYSRIKDKLSSNFGSNVVIYMGTNDLGSIEDSTSTYAEYINKLANDYSKSKIVVVSVTPIIDNNVIDYKDIVNDSNAVKFNNTLYNKLNSNVLYCNIHDENFEYYAGDGIHYDSSTYREIYNAILKCLK